MRVRGKSPHELESCEYMQSTVLDGGEDFEAWWVCTPNGLLGRLSSPYDVRTGRVKECHRVVEHDDGEISVSCPKPGESANSILVTGWPLHETRLREPGEGLMSWHGYIEHGVWNAV